MTSQTQQIVERLNHIQLDIDFIKSHLSDLDLVLSNDDLDALHDAEEVL